MLRGGSFKDNRDNVGCGARDRNNPDNRNNNIGFRVAASTFSLDGFPSEMPGGQAGLPGRERKMAGSVPGRAPLTLPKRGAGRIATTLRPGKPAWRGVTSSQRRRMYEEIRSWSNLLRDFHKAAKGKRGQANVSAFEHRLEDNLLRLREELGRECYRPEHYVNFLIHDPKRRLISAAPFRDRVVHHALCNLLEPVFERTFIPDSYANRLGRGTHSARRRVQGLARRHPYFLQCDIRQFFPSVDHEILRAVLAGKIKDEKVLKLIDLILDGGADILRRQHKMVFFPGDDLLAVVRPRGLPIGNLTSQFWANCYLNPFDHFVKRELRCRGYVRYVDDFVLFSDSKSQLWEWKERIERRLERFRLKIHRGSHPRPVEEGVSFLGFIIIPERIRLKRRNGTHFRRRLKAQIASYVQREISLDKMNASVLGWVNHARFGNTVGLRRSILWNAVIPRRKPALLKD